MLNSLHGECLSEAFTKLLKKSSDGTMAYVRALPADAMSELCSRKMLRVLDWQIFYVTDEVDTESSYITADQAVDIRESKEGSVLLLVDTRTAGAGMDGIYSAVREIDEAELMPKAINAALKRFQDSALKEFADAAVKRARKIGKANTISPWREFDFYVHCASEPEKIGINVALLGLWPISTIDVLQVSDIALSSQVVDRLLLASGAENTPQVRVASLLLGEDQTDLATRLEKFLREFDGLRWSEVGLKAAEVPELLLNNLIPGFNSEDVISLELVCWQSKPDANPYAWSGMVLTEDKDLEFRINQESKLEVRWKVLPATLKSGATEYKVSIVTGSDVELASRQVSHSGKSQEKCVFVFDDFSEFEGNEKWQAKIVVHPVEEPKPLDGAGDSPRWKETREFILTFGQKDVRTKSSVGKKARALVEEAIRLSEENFGKAASQTRKPGDSQGFVSFTVEGQTGRAFRPELIKLVEEDWRSNSFALGRWSVRVRTDGSRTGSLTFIPLEATEYPIEQLKKLQDTTRQFGQKALDQGGFVGVIYHNNDSAANYVNSWISSIDTGDPKFALANTVEVQDLTGETVGLIVLPSHPLRVAWHSAYDELAYNSRYVEKLTTAETVNTLKLLDGSFMPLFLPGIEGGQSFVFGDSLGFYTVAMVLDGEPEPKAMIAQMMRCLSSASEDLVTSVGGTTAAAIAHELKKYETLHDQYRNLHVNAFHAGDGKTVAQAIGMTFDDESSDDESKPRESTKQGIMLNMFPSPDSRNSRLVGRYFAEAAERRRAGAGAGGTSSDDRWMVSTYEIGNTVIPRLKWAKRDALTPSESAHISIAFDVFDSSVVPEESDRTGVSAAIEAFGLIPSLIRKFNLEPVPTWTLALAQQVEGEKHPYNRVFSERLHKIHSALVRSTARNLTPQTAEIGVNGWATLRTQLNHEQVERVQLFHKLSDWVVIIDRNAGIEYFDAPRDASEVYETFVIDCVPERQNMGSLQLITSTAQIDEVLGLLEDSLDQMDLSHSPRNGRFLLSNLKAISGRLAMRLAERGQVRSEMIALGMFYAGCAKFGGDANWPSLISGFLVPLDDVRDLMPVSKGEGDVESPDEAGTDAAMLRADLVYVGLTKKGALKFSFIEIKYRRLLRSARDPKLHEHVFRQLMTTRERWMRTHFAESLSQTQAALRRKRLAHALRFYLDKAERHLLATDSHSKLSAAIDKLLRSETEVSHDWSSDRGYIFCPEHPGEIECVDGENADGQIRIFGASTLPDLPYVFKTPARNEQTETIGSLSGAGNVLEIDFEVKTEIQTESMLGDEEVTEVQTVVSVEDVKHESVEHVEGEYDAHDEGEDNSPDEEQVLELRVAQEGVDLYLGDSLMSESPISWNMSLRGNPHLMIAGLPGMGKTTCIINLCEQLAKGGITPVVFSYHDDIETKLASRFSNLSLIDIDNGLGFNPLQVSDGHAHAWLDNIGKLRDIFSAVYKDFGEIQLNDIREAIKESYREVGYGSGSGERASDLPVPDFSRFYEILRGKQRPNAGIIARLEELNDYGLFNTSTERASVLEMTDPIIIRLHTIQNEVLQNAMASFVLLNIYQSMLLRGSQPTLTHAVIFDEAHRASRLKLVPTMAKESRKFGISMIVASQEARDFSDSLYAAIANYLVLRVTETDAKALAKNVVLSTEVGTVAGRLKALEKYSAMFFTEGRRPIALRLAFGD